MDEILATIRRIIAEDEQPGGPATASAGTGSGAGTGTDTRVAAGGAAPGGLDREAPAKDTAADTADDIVELTEAINEDGSVRHLAPIGGTSRIAQLRAPAPVAAGVEPEFEPAAPPADAPSLSAAPEHTLMPGPTGDERLVSGVASSAAAAAFAPPASAPPEARPEREVSLGAADRSLEDIVRDLLRPVLQAWVDEHLPEIVERLAQAEIARVGKPGPG